MKSQRETIESIVSLSIAIDIQAMATRAVYLKHGGVNGSKQQEEIALLSVRLTTSIEDFLEED